MSESEARPEYSAEFTNDLRSHFERVRSHLAATLETSLGQAEVEFQRAMVLAVERVTSLEREQLRYAETVRRLETELTQRVMALESLERTLREELGARDRRIEELEGAQSLWAQRLHALTDLRRQIDAVIPWNLPVPAVPQNDD